MRRIRFLMELSPKLEPGGRRPAGRTGNTRQGLVVFPRNFGRYYSANLGVWNSGSERLRGDREARPGL